MECEFISTEEMAECISKYSFIYDSLHNYLSELCRLEMTADVRTQDKLNGCIMQLSVLIQKLLDFITSLKSTAAKYSYTEQDLTRMVRERLMVCYDGASNGYVIAQTEIELKQSWLLENKTIRHETWIIDKIAGTK
ncbi:MAG: hypothetical protein Q4F95_15940 [Oscillospiraceae bacterium]|nr:hypothetical protein [Oscillospiraceae bacterium]